jgi:hypothetical protein
VERATKLFAMGLITSLLFTSVLAYVLLERTDSLTDEIQNLKNTLNTPNGYDYVVFQDGAYVKAKNAQNQIEFTSNDFSTVLNKAVESGSTINVQSGRYVLNSDIKLCNRSYVVVSAQGVTLQGNGHKIIIYGDSYEISQYNRLEGLMIIDGTIRIENSYRTKISGVTFENCTVAVELANSYTWTEATRIDDAHFERCQKGIVFETPVFNGTNSYSKTEISNCNFNIYDSATAITIEDNANFVDGTIRDVRFWLKNSSATQSQTGIYLAGSMMNTYLTEVVFESFTNRTDFPNTDRFGLYYSESTLEPPIIGSGVQFLGDFTNPVNNPSNEHVYGVGGLFKGKLSFSKTEIVHAYPLRIADFDLELTVSNMLPNEVLTVNVTTNFVDQSQLSTQIQFAQDGSRWLSNNEKYEIYPSRNLLNSIALYVDSSVSNSEAQVAVRWVAETA